MFDILTATATSFNGSHGAETLRLDLGLKTYSSKEEKSRPSETFRIAIRNAKEHALSSPLTRWQWVSLKLPSIDRHAIDGQEEVYVNIASAAKRLDLSFFKVIRLCWSGGFFKWVKDNRGRLEKIDAQIDSWKLKDWRDVQNHYNENGWEDYRKNLSHYVATVQERKVQFSPKTEKIDDKKRKVSEDTKETDGEGEGCKAYEKRIKEKTAKRTFEELAEKNSGKILWQHMFHAFENYAVSKGFAGDKYRMDHLRGIFLETLDECELGEIEPVGFQACFMEKIKKVAQNFQEEDLAPGMFQFAYEWNQIVQDSESKQLYDMAKSGEWSEGKKTVKAFLMTNVQIEELQEKSSELFKSESFQKCLKIFREQR